jgi:hypothetical protein
MQEDASCTTALNIYELGGEASPLNDVLKAFYRMPIRAYDGRMSRARSSPRIPFRSVGSEAAHHGPASATRFVH